MAFFDDLISNINIMPKFTFQQMLWVTLLSGVACLDRLASLSIMVSRPFIIGLLVGLIFNNILVGIIVGTIFEFIGMLEVPVGTRITHDDTFGSLVATTLFASGSVPFNAFYFLLSVILISLAIYPVTASDKIFRYFNRHAIDIDFHESIVKSHKESVIIFLGIFLAIIKGVLLYWIAIFIIYPIIQVTENINIATYEGARLFQEPKVALIILFIFMSGYFLRFLNTKKNIYKLIAIVCGSLVGWFIL